MKMTPPLAFLVLFAAAQGALAQPNPPHPGETRAETVGRKTGEIVSQPAKDVGLMKTEIPPILQAAADAPYATKGLSACKALGLEIARLNTALGPDFGASPITENRAGAFASAGGQAVINSLIPFRGLVREVSGAGPAQRRLNAALDAGYARRGYLRGIYVTRKCKPAI
jgi:hypothetical protein